MEEIEKLYEELFFKHLEIKKCLEEIEEIIDKKI